MHVKKEHRQAWKGDTTTLYRRVQVQTFFATGGLQQYFTVKAVEDGNGGAPSIPRGVADVVRARLAGWEVTRQAHEEKAQVMDAEAAKTDKTGWFKRTGWLEHLAKRNLVHLAHQIRLPDQGEVKLQRAAKLVELLVERSVAGLWTLARETRRWLRSVKRQEIDQRPIGRLQNPESQARYAGYMVKFVCYFLRIVADEQAGMARSGRSEDGGSDVGSEQADEEDVSDDWSSGSTLR